MLIDGPRRVSNGGPRRGVTGYFRAGWRCSPDFPKAILRRFFGPRVHPQVSRARLRLNGIPAGCADWPFHHRPHIDGCFSGHRGRGVGGHGGMELWATEKLVFRPQPRRNRRVVQIRVSPMAGGSRQRGSAGLACNRSRIRRGARSFVWSRAWLPGLSACPLGTPPLTPHTVRDTWAGSAACWPLHP